MQAAKTHAPSSLQGAAEENLHYIRAAMSASGAFTAVSGAGAMVAGIAGCAASVLTLLTPLGEQWPLVWLAAAALAMPAGMGLTVRKTVRSGASLTQGVGRRFLFALLPGFAATALLSLSMLRAADWSLVAATWLLGYGASICAAGSMSVRAVRVLGLVCMACGAVATVASPLQQQWLLLASFGGAHLVIGAYVWKHHGG